MLEQDNAEMVLGLHAGTEEPMELSRSWEISKLEGLAQSCLLVLGHPVHQTLGCRSRFSLCLKLEREFSTELIFPMPELENQHEPRSEPQGHLDIKVTLSLITFLHVLSDICIAGF